MKLGAASFISGKVDGVGKQQLTDGRHPPLTLLLLPPLPLFFSLPFSFSSFFPFSGAYA